MHEDLGLLLGRGMGCNALACPSLKLLPFRRILKSCCSNGKYVDIIKWIHWFPRRIPPGQYKEQWMVIWSNDSKIPHKMTIQGGLYAFKLNLVLSNKNTINSRMMQAMYNNWGILMLTMQSNQVLCPQQLLQEISVGMDIGGCTSIMTADVWRVQTKSGVKITHQYHQILSWNMMQKLIQVNPDFGWSLEELIFAFDNIPRMLIYNYEVICAVQEKANVKNASVHMWSRCYLLRAGNWTMDEYQNGYILHGGVDIVPTLRCPGSIEILINFLQCNNVEWLYIAPI